MQNSIVVPSKTKSRVTIWYNNPTPGHITEETIIEKDTYPPAFTAALFTIAPRYPWTDEQTKKRWSIQTREPYSAIKKEGSWARSERDKPRAFPTERSKSEKQISYIKAYTWNLERWYWWTCLKGRKGDTGLENSGGRRGANGDGSMHTHCICCVA